MYASKAAEQGSATDSRCLRLSAMDSDIYDCAAAGLEDDTVEEAFGTNPMRNCTRSRSKKVVIPEPLMPSETENTESRPPCSKRNHASHCVLSASGHARYFHRNSNQFPDAASNLKWLKARRGRAGNHGLE